MADYASDVLAELLILLEGPIPNAQNIKNVLDTFTTAVADGGPEVRGYAIEDGGYQLICKAWTKFCDSGEFNVRLLTDEAAIIREATLRALWAITPGHPDIIDETGFTMIFQAFDPKINERTKIEALKFMRNICIKSEKNREALASDWLITEPFVNVIKVEAPSLDLVREWCGALRTYVLNDDRRVAYNRAPERKRMVFDLNGHNYLAQFINHITDVPTLNAIVNVMGIMASNEDMCIGLEANGAFRGLNFILITYGSDLHLIKNTISTIRYLNISPIVRGKCEGYNLMKPVLEAAHRYREDAEFSAIAMSCLAFMTIRSPCAVSQFLVDRGVFVVTEIMKLHMTAVYVLKGGCLTLRNVAASGGPVGRATITEEKGEDLLREVANAHPTLVENHINPTLRDLNLEPIVIDANAAEQKPIPEVQDLEEAAWKDAQSSRQ